MSWRKYISATSGVIFILSLASLNAGAVTSREYPYYYKSPRAMGMGGAYIAIGGRTDTLFYNPAGLGTMPEEDVEANVFGLTGEIGKNTRSFIKDMQDAFDTKDLNGDGSSDDDRLRAVNNMLSDYNGENLHLRVADFSSGGYNSGSFAFGIGGLASARMDAMPHQGLGSDGLLSVDADALYGGIGGVSFRIVDGLYLGGALKYYHKEAIDHNFTARELVEKQDTLDDYITKDLRESGNALGLDAGMIYRYSRSSLKPSVGLSILDIGDTDFNDAGKMPMTVNLGIAINPEIPIFNSLTVGLDYVDILDNYDQDKDIGKRLRFGGELVLFDKMLAAMALRAGSYEGSLTYGVDLRLLIFQLSYVSYAEEIGAYAGQDKDRRHLVMLNAGW